MRQQDHQPRPEVSLSAEQFDKLIEMLRPGYEMGKLMLADQQARAARHAEASFPQVSETTDEPKED